jgi:drug/metabolite transporter (DMT)-like permease
LFNISWGISPLIIGGISALISALLWAISAIIFRNLGKSIPPAELNLVKGSFAVSLMIVTTLLLHEKLPQMPTLMLGLLLVSGAVGIGIGDTAYFESLNHMGSRLALLLAMLAPPMTGAIAWIFLGESISLLGWIGIVITIAGIIWVISEEQTDERKIAINYKQGIKFAVISALAQAIGAVITRFAMTSADVTISALQLSIIRLLAGILFLIIYIQISGRKPFTWLRKNSNEQHVSRYKLLRLIALVGLLGTYSAIWLQSISIQFAPVAIAQTLLSTSPLFILPIIALRGEKLSFRAVGGVVVSLVGIILLFNQ